MPEDQTPSPTKSTEFSAPTETMENCLGISGQVYTAKADAFVSAEEIYAITGKPRGTMSMKVSACGQYGFIVNYPGQGYKVASDAIAIINPEFEEDARRRLLKAFSVPPLYQKLIERYNSKTLPTSEGLKNVLISEYGLNANSTAPKAASVFLENCAYLKINEGGRLRYFIPHSGNQKPNEQNNGGGEQNPPPPIPPKDETNFEVPIDLGAKTAYLKYPRDISEAEIGILKIILDAQLVALAARAKQKASESGG